MEDKDINEIATKCFKLMIDEVEKRRVGIDSVDYISTIITITAAMSAKTVIGVCDNLGDLEFIKIYHENLDSIISKNIKKAWKKK